MQINQAWNTFLLAAIEAKRLSGTCKINGGMAMLISDAELHANELTFRTSRAGWPMSFRLIIAGQLMTGDARGGMGPDAKVSLTGPVVKPPKLIRKVDPEYSEDGRKAKLEGTAVLRIRIDEKGKVQFLMMLRPLGLGLDEKAIEAVQKWRFKPAVENGRPVKSDAEVELNFRPH